MKSLFIIILALLTIFETSIANNLVSTEPQPRNVVLEEFTGIHCGNCPGGHKAARELAEENPGRVVVLSIHEGSYAIPGAGEPDFRTQYGPAILSQASVTGFPAGTINREVFPGQGEFPYFTQKTNGMAMSVSGWKNAAYDSVLDGRLSPVNIAAETSWNNDTRQLEVYVEVYFTDDIPNDVKLNVALLESHVIGPQTGAADPKNYEHNHIFRDYLTGQWGETISKTDLGSLFKQTYTYHVSEDFNIVNCDLALFITDNQNRNIYTGIDIRIIPPKVSMKFSGDRLMNAHTKTNSSLDLRLQNLSDKEITFNIAVKQSDITPKEWTVEFLDGNAVTIMAHGFATKTFNFKTNGKYGYGDYYFTVSEKDNPISNSLRDSIQWITGDTRYLEVDAGGSIIEDAQDSRNDFISLPIDIYERVRERLYNVELAVWNTGPTGRIDTAQAAMIENLLKSGVNTLISGSGGVPGLALNYPNHSLLSELGISWSAINELPFTNFSLVGFSYDPVSSGFNAQDLSVANNGYMMQKIDITAPSKAVPMIKLVETGDAVSVRTVNSFTRSIYLGFNPFIIEDDALRTGLITKCLDWLEGKTNVEWQDDKDAQIYMRASISLLSGELIVKIKSEKNYQNANIELYKLSGVRVQTIRKGAIEAGESAFSAPVDLPRGLYFVRLIADDVVLAEPVMK